MGQNPISQVLVSIDKTFQNEITTQSGLKFYLDGSFQKNFTCTVTATIESLPVNPHPDHKDTISRLKVGDEVAISYQVVSSLSFGSDRDRFMETVEPTDYVKDYRNGKGERLSIYALPKRRGIEDTPMWVGVYQNKYGALLDGVQGTEHEVSRWQSQFQFGKTDEYTFDNFFEYDGNDYWQCSPDQIFAKKVKGHLVAISDRVICIPIEETVPDGMLLGQHKGHNVKLRFQDRGRVLSSATKEFKKDEVISFSQDQVEKYEFWDKNYYLIREDFIRGKWSKN